MSSLFNPELYSQFQKTNPAFVEQIRQMQQGQTAATPNVSQPTSTAATPPPVQAQRRRAYPSMGRGHLFHSRPFSHIGRK